MDAALLQTDCRRKSQLAENTGADCLPAASMALALSSRPPTVYCAGRAPKTGFSIESLGLGTRYGCRKATNSGGTQPWRGVCLGITAHW